MLDDICFYRAISTVHNEFMRSIDSDTEGASAKKQNEQVKRLPLFTEYQNAVWSSEGSKKLNDIGIYLC